ncbi:MAG: hypothetical protein WC554_07080 [Clostridia bacterium]|jgi:hypothetical protein
MGQAKRRGTFEQRRDAAIKLYNEKQAERDREADRNYVAPYGRANSLLPLYGLSAKRRSALANCYFDF